MRAIEIIRNGSVLCLAGTENASLLTLRFNLFVGEPGHGTLGVTGMNELENGRSSHTYWLEDEVVAPGESLNIRFTESDSATSPRTEIATDSEQYKSQREWYEGEVAKGLFEPSAVQRQWPGGSLSFSALGAEPVVATFEGGREFIALSLSWNRWRPDVCRYSLSSFSQAEAIARAGSREWLEGKLQLEECCQVGLGT